jgi:hypothetical protein
MVSRLKAIYWQVTSGYGIPGDYLPDYLFLVQQYWLTFGKLRLFVRPRTYNELLYHKMLRARDSRMRTATEKVSAREYAAARIGAEYLVPLLHVGDDPTQIPLDKLPNQFVIKASHGSGLVIIVSDKSKLDAGELRKRLRAWLAIDWYRLRREWAYKDIPRRFMVEELLLEGGEVPADYKFFVFKGRVRMVMVNGPTGRAAPVQGRNKHPTNDFFDERWRPLVVTKGKPRGTIPPLRPNNFAEMIRLAEKLGADFEFCRVDLYSIEGRIFFGEITQYPGGGLWTLTPPEFDLALGNVWRNAAPIPDRFFA